jgi:hypothetical protein
MSGVPVTYAPAEFFGELPAEGATNAATVSAAEKLLARLSLDKRARGEAAVAAAAEGAAGKGAVGGGGGTDAAAAATFSEAREYKYCTDLVHAADVRKKEAEAGEAGAADLAAAAAIAGETPAFATWALLIFDQPITCPVDSLYIASRLDTDIHQNTCRLAFHGRLIHPINLEHDPRAAKRIKVGRQRIGRRRHGVLLLSSRALLPGPPSIPASHVILIISIGDPTFLCK